VGRELGVTLYGDRPVTTRAVIANNIIRYLKVEPGVRLATENYNDIKLRGGRHTVGIRGRHDLRVPPLFLGLGPPSWMRFRLRAGSPCIAAGSSAFGPRVDVTGRRRGNPPSLGAFQFVRLPQSD